MTITIDLPKKGVIKNNHMTYEELLQWIAMYDSDIVEEFMYIKKMSNDLKNKEYTITSSL